MLSKVFKTVVVVLVFMFMVSACASSGVKEIKPVVETPATTPVPTPVVLGKDFKPEPDEVAVTRILEKLSSTDPRKVFHKSLTKSLGDDIDALVPKGTKVVVDQGTWRQQDRKTGTISAVFTFPEQSPVRLSIGFVKDGKEWKILSSTSVG